MNNSQQQVYKEFFIVPSMGVGKTISVQVLNKAGAGLLYWSDGWDSVDAALEDAKQWIDENFKAPQIDGFCQTSEAGEWIWSDGEDEITIFNVPNTHLYAYSVNGNRYYPSAQSVEEAADMAFSTLDYLDGLDMADECDNEDDPLY